MSEKMTKTQKEKWTERIIGAVVSVIVAIAIYSFTFTNDVNYTEQKELKEAVIRLDKEKVDAPFVEKKCLETRALFESQQQRTDKRLDNIEQTTQKIYDYLLNQKK